MKKSELKQLIKECMAEMNETPVTPTVSIAPTTTPIKLDIKRVVDVEVGGVDKHDYPDFSDSFIERGGYEISKEEFATTDKALNPVEHNGRFFRDLTEDELDQLNREHPELAQEKAHESMQGAGDNYRDYYEDR